MVDCMKYIGEYIGSNGNTISSILACIIIMEQKTTKLRFKRKTFGWWWTPASRQGRAILIVYCVLVFGRVMFYKNMAEDDQQQRVWTSFEVDAWGNLLVALVPIIVFTCLLLGICYKTWEKPKRQRWNKKKSL